MRDFCFHKKKGILADEDIGSRYLLLFIAKASCQHNQIYIFFLGKTAEC